MRKMIPTLAIALSILTGAGVAVAADPNAITTGNPYFVPMPEITIPIVGLSRIEGTLNATLTLEVGDVDAIAAISAKMPELRAASLATALEFGRLHASGFTAVNAEQLNADLTAALRQVHPEVGSVLIVKLSAQPA